MFLSLRTNENGKKKMQQLKRTEQSIGKISAIKSKKQQGTYDTSVCVHTSVFWCVPFLDCVCCMQSACINFV